MLTRLTSWDTDGIEKILPEDSYSVFARAVIHNTANGRVYLDESVTPPVVAIVSSEEERCYFTLSSTKDDLDYWLNGFKETVLKDQFDESRSSLECFLSPNVDESVHTLFRKLHAAWSPAFLYSITHIKTRLSECNIPEGYRVVPITEELLAKKDIQNKRLILDEWSARKASVQGVRGFCALKGARIVAVCHIDFLCADMLEIGVITESNHRRKGLSTAVASKSVEYFLSSGIRKILWHAPTDNVGSCKVAEACGLCVEREFGEYNVHYKEGYSLLLQGYSNVRKGNYHEAADIYRQALAADKGEKQPFSGWHSRKEVLSWIIGCYAGENDIETLMKFLHEITEANELTKKHIIALVDIDEDCASLRKTEVWKQYCL